jgi:hypothetical protein
MLNATNFEGKENVEGNLLDMCLKENETQVVTKYFQTQLDQRVAAWSKKNT